MTKYILIGGYPSKASDGGKALAEELVKGYEQPVKILDVPFARPPERAAQTLKNDEEFFHHNLPNTMIDIQLAQLDY
jgi:hypothetical protein